MQPKLGSTLNMFQGIIDEEGFPGKQAMVLKNLCKNLRFGFSHPHLVGEIKAVKASLKPFKLSGTHGFPDEIDMELVGIA